MTIEPSSHPEIELRAAGFRNTEPGGITHTTLLNLLEIYPDKAAWAPDLDHARLLRHFDHSSELPRLRIFFIEDLDFLDWSRWKTNDNPNLEPNDTAHWMQQRFGVSPLFFDGMTSRHFSGNASFVRKGHGRRVSLDGLYRFKSGISTPLTLVWFSHSLDQVPSSTYMIYQYTESVKNTILSCTHPDTTSSLLRPLAIDAFLAEDCLFALGADVLQPRNELIKYERRKFARFTPEQVAMAVENLHALSQRFNVISGHLADHHERINFLLKVHRRLLYTSEYYNTHTSSRRYAPWSFDEMPEEFPRPRMEYTNHSETEEPEDIESVLDSFDFILSKTDVLKRWVLNYNERTGIRINLFFNISTQTDNKTNLDIARLTSKIAVSTQRDSSSMITMAAVTMLFLPGTFVSALFSMVFFNSQSDNTLVVSEQIWLFFAITIPLTVAVFVLWLFWRRYRNEAEARSLGLSDDDLILNSEGKDAAHSKMLINEE
ncbi:Notoamide biosynthesis cluster protein M' [Psilocybe cubensis]|uniref:Notoamide biosynthesis cluster protein M n=2 Tax=Psilocybe cubensis TaxID=181762 RepID=A0ACB8GH78_PSICU|nr:Notoamide biosynthesis cluster protein M' [Psilocybe cubensis]KAH9474913.1 Notoamide biosynthesis cluster protein M' [Psilocybe cubensis]